MPSVSPGSLLDEYRTVLMNNGWFAGLPDAAVADIVTRARRLRLATREPLFRKGDPSDGMYCVLSGVLRLSGSTRDGRETILDFYGPGSWIGEVATLDGAPRIYDATAERAVELLQLTPATLESLLERHPAFSRALLRLQAQRVRILLSALVSYSTQTLAERLASRLLMLAAHHGEITTQGAAIALRLPHETLARLTGATRQRVTQILCEWEAAGIVRRSRGHLTIIDADRLQAQAEV